MCESELGSNIIVQLFVQFHDVQSKVSDIIGSFRGRLILWACKELGNALKRSPIDTLIHSCLLEERSCAASYNYDAPGATYTLKWTFHNDLGLVFVDVYPRILHLLYVDDLLAMVKRAFSEIYDPTLQRLR
ncbi:hypothetical protein Vadar_026905 [Vaccinium darrowii]|uniref:Uncharacterized protein n=1 Tax=Vaccinium darrowii TaxID=229202 RepID=A0ACB7Y3C4_9ERIC|nr:hypothetical protein Vadar_026905 [Vaccinium darrowii]